MDDPALAWPAWKFGMRRDAIHSTLHDQYNTFQSTIQDPEAFQHDVHEIASEAASVAEFHQMLSERRELRLNELNDSLESASFEIIANPMLISTKQWQHAVQLFRTRSLDSLVRFFSSYLPSDHPWYQPTHNQKRIGNGDVSKDAFDHDDLPPSPRSITTISDDMETSAHDLYSIKSMNTMSSYSDSDSKAGDDELKESINNNENEAVNTTTNVAVENVHNDTKNIETIEPIDPTESNTDVSDDDCSSQSSGPETPDSMSDAEPDVDVTDDDAHVHSHISHTMDRHVQQHITPKAMSPKVPEKTAEFENQTINTVTTTLTRRSPLQSGFAVDATRCSSPMPLPIPHSSHSLSHSSLSALHSPLLPVSAAVRSRQRSVSPSRPSPLHAHRHISLDHCEHDPDSLNENGRGAGRLSRSRLCSTSFAQQRLASPSRSSRRRPGVSVGGGITAGTKVEKTPTLPRPMRTRLRERREAAAATIQRD